MEVMGKCGFDNRNVDIEYHSGLTQDIVDVAALPFDVASDVARAKIPIYIALHKIHNLIP